MQSSVGRARARGWRAKKWSHWNWKAFGDLLFARSKQLADLVSTVHLYPSSWAGLFFWAFLGTKRTSLYDRDASNLPEG